MNHLDEGTIHAWLDGELDVARAREVREHVDGCAACSALVAESRGLMAGASRILSALDDVPAKVTPMRAPAPATRQWRAAPWVSGIAAAAMLAVGIATLQREPTAASKLAEPVQIAFDSAKPADVRPTPAAAPAQPSALVPTTPARRDAAQQRAAASGAGAGGAGTRGAVAELAGPAAAPRAESRPLAAVPAPAPAPVTTAAASAAADESKDVKREAADPKSVMMKSSALGDAAFYGSGLSEFVGCYRLTARSRQNVVARTVEAAGAVAAAARNRAAAPTAAPAPTTQLVAPAPPSYVRLDTVKHPLGYIARSASNDSAIGTWNRVGSDSVRVDLLVRGLFTLTRTERIGCPQ